MKPAFDVIGDIAIADVPKGSKTKDVAKQIMENRHIKSVYKKASSREGLFRTRKLRFIAGEKSSLTTHKENGISLKLDVKKAYFSPREGTERMRIVEKINQINPSADLALTFFCGVGPLPITISKKTNVKQVAGIDINPSAVKYFKENIILNKCRNVEAICGDVKTESKKFYGKCDFVTMPLPETAWKFLDHAIKCLKPDGICFFYAFSPEKELYGKWIKKIESAAKKQNRKVKILETRKVLPFASRVWKVRIDFQVI